MEPAPQVLGVGGELGRLVGPEATATAAAASSTTAIATASWVAWTRLRASEMRRPASAAPVSAVAAARAAPMLASARSR